MLTIAIAGGVIYWVESDKELKILGSMIEQGESIDEVYRLLDTGELLHYEAREGRIVVTSHFNLKTTQFTVSFSESNEVQHVAYGQAIKLGEIAAYSAGVVTFLLLLFQSMLAMGFPLGEWAWGGFYKELPTSLRVSSAVSAVVLVVPIAALADILQFHMLPGDMSVYIVTGFTILFMLSLFGNLASVSRKEKMLMIPVSVVLVLSYFTVAYSNL